MQGFDIKFRSTRARPCRVRVGVGAIDQLVEDLVADPPGSRLFVVADDRVAGLYGRSLCERLAARALPVDLLGFSRGEQHKTRETKSVLEDRLVALGAGRDCAVIALGGGVTGDLAGFLAATWQRGVPLVQVPTTLLAMVDAALGGKTAVNLPAGKNLIGAFHQPRAIYADPAVLETLDHELYREGLAEMIKAGVVADVTFFRWLERNVAALGNRETGAQEEAILAALRIKGRIVRRDERESDRRAALNFGHTVGHAIESVSGFRVRHGNAVAIGMAVEGRLAQAETGFPNAHLRRLERLLDAAELPRELPSDLPVSDVIEATARDKKAREGRVRFALPVALGKMPGDSSVTRVVAEGRLRTALEASARAN